MANPLRSTWTEPSRTGPTRRRAVVWNRRPRISAAVALPCLSVFVAGCLTPSPFRDTLTQLPSPTTPSVEGVRAAGVTLRAIEPVGEPKIVRTADAPVTHLPLYFEDPCETSGSDDGRFAWTREDYAYLLTGGPRFLLNLVTVPAEKVCIPPWSVRESDGYADYCRGWWRVDARPSDACAERG